MGDQKLIEEAYKKLEAAIKKSAKDIRDKYMIHQILLILQ